MSAVNLKSVDELEKIIGTNIVKLGTGAEGIAYLSLNDLDAIEISWHTMDKDTIREYKSKSIEARNEIKQMEKEYLKSLNATDTPNEKKTDKSYLILCTIFFLVLLLLWCIDRFFL